ncbi:MAG: polysaccharide biosynthesis C-terminal domain-containing protein [Bacteroidota bacterium]
MGIVIRQSFWSSIFLFLGVVLGALNVLVLFKQVLGDELFGLTRILLSFSFIGAEFAMLGSPTMLIKYFPFFKEEKKKGIILFAFCIASIGIILVSLMLILFKEDFISAKEGDAELISGYYFISIIALIGVAFYKFFQAYFKALLDTVIPVFLNDFMLRLYVTLWLLAYQYLSIPLYEWMLGFGLLYLINPLLMTVILFYRKKIDFSWNKRIDNAFRKEAISYGFWNLMAGASMSIVNSIDILMLGWLLMKAEEQVAVYSRALYIAALIIIPLRAIGNIVQPLVANMFKEENYEGLIRIYKQSSINQLIVSGLVFVLIWINIEEIFWILGDDASIAKWVVFFIGLSKVFSVATGVNGIIINHSKYFKFTTYFIVVLAILTVLFNQLLIPKYQLLGAAIATSFALFSFNFLKWLFVWIRLKMQPFDLNSLKVLITGIITVLICNFIPHFFEVDLIGELSTIVLRSLVATILFISVILAFNLSDEVKGIYKSISNKFLP